MGAATLGHHTQTFSAPTLSLPRFAYAAQGRGRIAKQRGWFSTRPFAMSHVFTAQREDNLLGDILGVIADALETF